MLKYTLNACVWREVDVCVWERGPHMEGMCMIVIGESSDGGG